MSFIKCLSLPGPLPLSVYELVSMINTLRYYVRAFLYKYSPSFLAMSIYDFIFQD